MKLIINQNKIPKIGETENQKDPVAVIKLFHPMSNWAWYITEYCSEDKLCFGLVDGHEKELGYFALDELEALKIRGLGVERDLHWTPVPLSKIVEDV
jgi:hypothetical protein